MPRTWGTFCILIAFEPSLRFFELCSSSVDSLSCNIPVAPISSSEEVSADVELQSDSATSSLHFLFLSLFSLRFFFPFAPTSAFSFSTFSLSCFVLVFFFFWPGSVILSSVFATGNDGISFIQSVRIMRTYPRLNDSIILPTLT